MKDNVAIGKRIKEIRTQFGLSQGAFGGPLGLSRGYISEMERGTRNISNRVLLHLGMVYGVSFQWLIGTEDQRSSPDLVSVIVEKLKTLSTDELLSINFQIDLVQHRHAKPVRRLISSVDP